MKRALLLMVLTAVVAPAGCGGGSGGDRDRAAGLITTEVSVGDSLAGSQAPVSHPRGAVEDCSSQSSADFTGAFSDPANLVAEPLVLVGSATPTRASVVKSVGGNKFPVLVTEGHVVTVQVPTRARGFASLGYGPMRQGEVGYRDGHDTVTFVACTAEDPPASSADGPVTFWSGFVFARRPACVPLDVYVDDEPAHRRVEIELGRPC